MRSAVSQTSAEEIARKNGLAARAEASECGVHSIPPAWSNQVHPGFGNYCGGGSPHRAMAEFSIPS